MLKEYDQITALHYAAYRPYLHSEILKTNLKSNKKYDVGLDIGCGTGQSSIALVHYCNKVLGIDSSSDMLDKSFDHPNVTYEIIHANELNFDADVFDIVTFAGSLYYAKSQAILDEIVRVAKQKCKIIIYDFELFLEDVFVQLELYDDLKQPTQYDHQTNFSGLNEQFLKLENEIQSLVTLEIAITDLAHLLLSSKDNYVRLVTAFGTNNLYTKLSRQLRLVINSDMTTLKARTYLTSYIVLK
ncbi:class I SAM-dependent methyltransferase [Maribacter sp. ACAM166]|uniref:class I SAM-dependent methyltransferase n=1 Tax=Maribacter sp. ACAM166 TaxID=2508996 RepID=UPI0010FD19B2|nr:class I SAM-dependent methyltransferase [Maribacter sp. ACAM166]TLP79682.1 class I SAM-dependent methyltransferase [Maribacter sp. ACAM166]